ncbi:MAG: ATP-grasp domain-containing protein [Oscillospiraceae bacterium]|nr:ATP-grasp domain-containing protein [Oscillospiraceae bacterium]
MEESENPLPAPKRVKLGLICNIKHPHAAGETADEEAEFDAPATVEAIRAALVRHGVDTVVLEAGPDLPQAIRDSGITMAYNIAEGSRGRSREAQVPALLEMLGIPYTGSDAVALGVSLDKLMCKRLVGACGVRTAASAVVADAKDIPAGLHYPVIVKPNAEGSGKGISEDCIAVDQAELARLLARDLPGCGSLLVEEYLPGREFTVGILGNGADRRIFPPMEIIYNGSTQRTFKVYSYEVKCNYKQHVRYECPAKLTAREAAQLTEAASKAFDALGCRDVARVDLRMDAAGEPCFLEINPLPGLAPGYSDLPMTAEAAGLDYDALVCGICEAAAQRLGVRL